MKENIQEQADEVVLHHDTQIVNMLFRELDAAKHRKELCGCPSCVKHVDAIEKMLEKALDLIAPGQPIPNT